jgi:Domain of unknown function (DUF4279)
MSAEWEIDQGEGRVRGGASLTILSTDMPPDELARRVGLQPDDVWTKGEIRLANRTHPFHGMAFESGLDERRSPTEHLEALMARLRPHARRIAAVTRLPTTHSTRVRVVEHTLRDNVETWANPGCLAELVELGADLVVDVYFYED